MGTLTRNGLSKFKQENLLLLPSKYIKKHLVFCHLQWNQNKSIHWSSLNFQEKFGGGSSIFAPVLGQYFCQLRFANQIFQYDTN